MDKHPTTDEVLKNITLIESPTRTYVLNRFTDKPVEFINDILEQGTKNELNGGETFVTGLQYNNLHLKKITLYVSKAGEEFLKNKIAIKNEYNNLLQRIKEHINKNKVNNNTSKPTMQKLEIKNLNTYVVDIYGNITSNNLKTTENPSRTQLLEDNVNYSEHDAENERFILGDTNSTENTYNKIINDKVVLPSLDNVPASMIKDFKELYK